ncbi:MAG: response regulator [Thermodesulfobacteriota bacterium]
MEAPRPKRNPLKSRTEFLAWAQDFSLKQKVLGGFLGVVVLVGLVTSLIGTRLAQHTIMETARSQLFGDLAAAGVVIENVKTDLELKVRLISRSEGMKELVETRNVDALRKAVTTAATRDEMDFWTVVDKQGNVLSVGGRKSEEGARITDDPVVAQAMEGKSVSAIVTMPLERIAKENPALIQRLLESSTRTGLVIEAAHPIVSESKIIGVLYGGILLNGNQPIVEDIARLLFKTAKPKSPSQITRSEGKTGYVGLCLSDKVVAGTLKELPPPDPQSLERGRSEIAREQFAGDMYLSAAQPIRDLSGNVIGAIKLATPEAPVDLIVYRLVATFMVLAVLGALCMATITYYLVMWVNNPLEQMLNAARKAAKGDLTVEVPVVARDEVGELAATFNLMVRNLAASQRKLEEWASDLASKVDEKTGELHQAREQVARIKKLASLEKMADGMAHIISHISDPFGGSAVSGEDEAPTHHIMLLDHDEATVDMSRRILESEGFEVMVATNVADALKELETEFYDVIVVDITMHEAGGTELLREIKYRQPELLVILTAPFKNTEEAVETVKLGAYDYIPKPFGPHQVLITVYAAIRARQTVEQTRRQLAQQRAETIFQRLPMAIALADKAHRVVYHNRAFVQLASSDGQEVVVKGKSFAELFGVDPLATKESKEESTASRWLKLDTLGRTAKLYNFKLPEEDLRVLMLLDVTETVMKDQQADVFRAETLTRAQQVIHQQMRVAQEIAGLLGETTAETKAALFELIKLAKASGEPR